jgi:hypothetical protein
VIQKHSNTWTYCNTHRHSSLDFWESVCRTENWIKNEAFRYVTSSSLFSLLFNPHEPGTAPKNLAGTPIGRSDSKLTNVCLFSSSITHNKLYYIRFTLATSFGSGTQPSSGH